MKPLYPIMAVLALAIVGAAPLRTLAIDGPTPVVKDLGSDDKHPVNVMTKVLAASPVARADAGKRMEQLLLSKYVAAEASAKVLGDNARKWGESDAKVDDVAVLYFFAGPGGALPAWAASDPILSKTFDSKYEERLRNSLSSGWTGEYQIHQHQEMERGPGFLNAAVKAAREIFNDPRTMPELEASINKHDVTGVKADIIHAAKTTLDGAAQQYGFDELYRNGAEVKEVIGPKDSGSRIISMKIYATRKADGTVVPEIGIFDITDPTNIYGQRFPITGGDQSFTLDDRTPGHKTYELKFGPGDASGNRSITFGRPGGGVALETSVKELYVKRANQAADLGNILNVGGEEFYVLPQGGAKGVLAMFPKTVVDARLTGDFRDLVPSLYAEVSRRGADGRSENIPAGDKKGPDLGTVGGKPYHLEFNKALGVWEVKDGVGDLPPKPDPKPTTGDGTTTGGSTATGDPKSLADAELLAKNLGCQIDDKKDLAEDMRNSYGLANCVDDAKVPYILLFVPAKLSPQLQMKFPRSPEFPLVRGRLVSHYMVTELDGVVAYSDLLTPKDQGFGAPPYSVADKVITPNIKEGVNGVREVEVLVDILRHYMDVKAGSPDEGAFTEVPKRLAEALKAAPGKFYLAAAYTTAGTDKPVLRVTLALNGKLSFLWPAVTTDGSPGDQTSAYAKLSGQANAMDGSVGSVDEPYKAKFEWDKRDALLVGGETEAAAKAAEANGAALYELRDPIGADTDKRYVVSFKYKVLYPKDPNNSDGPKETKVIRMKWIEVFNKERPHPGGVHVAGLLARDAVKDGTASGYGMVSGSVKEKGVLALFQNKQVTAENARNGAANCVGPFLWWGVSESEALEACRNGKF